MQQVYVFYQSKGSVAVCNREAADALQKVVGSYPKYQAVPVLDGAQYLLEGDEYEPPEDEEKPAEGFGDDDAF